MLSNYLACISTALFYADWAIAPYKFLVNENKGLGPPVGETPGFDDGVFNNAYNWSQVEL